MSSYSKTPFLANPSEKGMTPAMGIFRIQDVLLLFSLEFNYLFLAITLFFYH